MKSVVADNETTVTCVRIETVGGLILRFIAYPHDLSMSNGEVYQSDSGYQPTALSSTTTLAPAVLDLQGVFDAAGISRDELVSGVMDNARAYVFNTSWATPVEDEEPVGKFLLGKARIQDDRYVIEHMHLIDALNESVGRTYGPKCPWVLFDETLDGDTIPYQRSRCTGPRSAQDGPLLSAYKVTGTVTHVTSQKVWRDSSRAEAVNYFNYGSILWTTGDNAGLRSQEIKTHAADGTVTQYMATHYPVQVGDTYEMAPGCDGLRAGDCKTKFSNAANYGGFADMITSTAYTKHGTSGA
ncbi:MAG: DUF2163 domain-containing protein [Porticoccus sp.]|nr:DUF2163 domain-containing protein [Porticoccus sp.]